MSEQKQSEGGYAGAATGAYAQPQGYPAAPGGEYVQRGPQESDMGLPNYATSAGAGTPGAGKMQTPAGYPVSGQPQAGALPWPGPFHLNPGYCYLPHGQWQTMQPQYAAYPNPNMQQPYQMPFQAQAQQYYQQAPQFAGYPGMNQTAQPMQGQQPDYAQAYSAPAQEASSGYNGDDHDHYHHMHNTEETSESSPGAEQMFNPFGFFGQAAGMFGEQSGSEDPQHLEKKYGQLMELYNDFVQGKTDPSKIMNFLTSTGTHFWKGAIVGALLTLVMTNESVKATLKDCLGNLVPSKKE